MKKQEQETINAMRLQGKSASEIAWALGISVNTVRSHIRRHPELHGGKPCKNCGKLISALPGRKEKLFCSDKCRMAWWNNHREQVQKKAYYRLTCAHCGMLLELWELDEIPVTFKESLWHTLVDHATVYADERIVFHFKDGTEITAML